MLRTLRPIAVQSRHAQVTRNFITLPGTEAQSLTATRILPYKSESIYKLIADVDSYSSFVPYCLNSKVTKWSNPDKNGDRWPSQADLTIGWGGYEETFTSKLLCAPGSIVEALGGSAKTSIPRSSVPHHSDTFDIPAEGNAMFTSLNARWNIRPFHYKPPSGRPQTDNAVLPARDQTEVHLTLEFQFANPVYAALSKAVAPKIAGIMIEAFEVRARKLLDGPGAGVQEKDSSDQHFTAGKKIGA